MHACVHSHLAHNLLFALQFAKTVQDQVLDLHMVAEAEIKKFSPGYLPPNVGNMPPKI